MSKVIIKKLKLAKNVEDRNGKLRMQVKIDGKYVWISTGLDTTAHNIDLAVTKLSEVKTDIISGVYKKDPNKFWLKHFPYSAKAKLANKDVLLSELFTQFYEEREHELSFSMLNKLKTCKNWVKKFNLLDKPVQDITTAKLNKLRQESLKKRKLLPSKNIAICLDKY